VEWLHDKSTGSSSVLSIEFGCVTLEAATIPKGLTNNRLGLDSHILVHLKISFINTPRALSPSLTQFYSIFVCAAQFKKNITAICYLAIHDHKTKDKLFTFYFS
jgi:hypothetical protein